jgi:UPF0755 protein
MKKILLSILAVILIIILSVAYILFAPATKFSNNQHYLYVRDTGSAQEQIMHELDTGNIIRSTVVFNLIAKQAKAWQHVTPGRFEIKKGESIFSLMRTLRNNRQSAVRLVINKLRVREDFAKAIGKNFSTDSVTALNFLSNNDSLSQLSVDTNTLMTLIIPDTYFLNWNTSTKKILMHLKDNEENFWNKNNRVQKAEALNLTQNQVYTLASIVEEETNKNDEKGNIASVYINRLNADMKLSADPTIKYALKNFSLKRIYTGYLNVQSPYNTYMFKGLPPGPICTPSAVTIDAVLNAPQTNYLFFVARSDFSGYHQFTSNFADHEKYAKLYQQTLDSLITKKQQDSLSKTIQP